MNAVSSRRGASLVVVIWVTTIVAGLAVAFLREAGTDQLRLRNLSDEIRADAIIDAAFARTVLALMQTRNSWPALEPKTWEYDSATIIVDATPEFGRIDVNEAPLELIETVLIALNVDEEESTALLEAVAEQRGEVLADEDRFDLAADLAGDDEDAEPGVDSDAAEDEDSAAEEGPAFANLKEFIGLTTIEPRFFDYFTIFTGAPLPEMAFIERDLRTAIEAARITVEPDQADEEETEEVSSADEETEPEQEEIADLDVILRDRPNLAELASALGSSALFRIDLQAELNTGFVRRVRTIVGLDPDAEGKGYRVLDWQPMAAMEEDART